MTQCQVLAADSAQPADAHIKYLSSARPGKPNYSVPSMMHPQNVPGSPVQHGVPHMTTSQKTSSGHIQHGVPPMNNYWNSLAK